MYNKLMTIREAAKTGIMSEYALRRFAKQGKLPAIYMGNRCYINIEQLKKQIDNLQGNLYQESNLNKED